eukprot:TRINITY_DN516_c0_g2_i1.p1 TRINITY_DN516_c0_g2~~TRINITY_DN516_c0_g2_i1.p1  ORF type:complete len:259 (-),score=66.96 TRINITY_DN516_c0_g2_i1:660-1400(-)
MTEKRVRGTVITKPIVYGTIAFWLGGKKTEEGHTHKWTVFLRSPQNEDYSSFIKKVVFCLHPSFVPPKRPVEKPPYELSVTGWGEFDINIKIYLDCQEKPIDLFHPLKLYPPEGMNSSVKKPVVTETYDELVFVDPLESLHKKLSTPQKFLPPNPLAEHYTKYSDAADLKKIQEAHAVVKSELRKLNERMELLEKESQLYSGGKTVKKEREEEKTAEEETQKKKTRTDLQDSSIDLSASSEHFISK